MQELNRIECLAVNGGLWEIPVSALASYAQLNFYGTVLAVGAADALGAVSIFSFLHPLATVQNVGARFLGGSLIAAISYLITDEIKKIIQT